MEVTLNSDDHLTVVYQNLPAEVLESSSRAYDDRSLRELASSDPLTLRECFKAFTERWEMGRKGNSLTTTGRPLTAWIVVLLALASATCLLLRVP